MNKSEKAVDITPQKKQQKKLYYLEAISCFFYGAEEHGLICSKVNLASVYRHTWWIDSGATTHITVFM